MNILLVASAFNSLSQRLYAELSDLGDRQVNEVFPVRRAVNEPELARVIPY